MLRTTIAIVLINAICAASAWAITIDEADIGISRMIPKVGERVTWRVPVVNDEDERIQDDVTMTMRVGRCGEQLGEPQSQVKNVELASGETKDKLGESADFAFNWTAPENGYYRVVFEVPGADPRVAKTIAVTQEHVYFVWFGAPKQFQWCNVPTTVKDDEQQWWLRRGAIPAHWKGGVCFKERPVDKFVESWGAHDWIAIDEVGGPGEVTEEFIEAWRRLKEKKPEQWIAVWYMGAHEYWADIQDLVDLFLPEIYLNYRNNHLGQFDSYLRVAREAGVFDQVIPALGINQIKNKRGLIVNSPTKADVLRQFQYLKRTAPDLRGIGFFTSYSAAPGVAEYADGLCEKYFIRPVITLQDVQRPLSISGVAGDDERTASVETKNIGNMDAREVTVEWRYGWPEKGAELTTETVANWPVGESKRFSLQLPRRAGWRPIEFRISDGQSYTVLDGKARDYVWFAGQEFTGTPTVCLPAGSESDPMVRFVAARSPGPKMLVELDRDGGTRKLDVPCALLPSRPGRDEKIVAFPGERGADSPRMLLVADGDAPDTGPDYGFKNSVLTVEADHYTATLNCGNDQLTSLCLVDGGDNLLRSPWTLSAEGHSGFGEPRIEKLPGCVVATVPYESETASGESQYVFFDYAPVIRVARSWIPNGNVTLSRAADRCNLFQAGGTFALQPGVGGPLRRGRLHDGSQYRDLLFGYLGGAPRPGNAGRAGWVDFSYGSEGRPGGLGVAIEYRWRDSDMKSYDVTRLYDAGDWLEVLYVWGKEAVFSRPQMSCVYLLPHKRMDFTDAATTPPAKMLWNQLHEDQLKMTGEL